MWRVVIKMGLNTHYLTGEGGYCQWLSPIVHFTRVQNGTPESLMVTGFEAIFNLDCGCKSWYYNAKGR